MHTRDRRCSSTNAFVSVRGLVSTWSGVGGWMKMYKSWFFLVVTDDPRAHLGLFYSLERLAYVHLCMYVCTYVGMYVCV